jgi:hypothetical protein
MRVLVAALLVAAAAAVGVRAWLGQSSTKGGATKPSSML